MAPVLISLRNTKKMEGLYIESSYYVDSHYCPCNNGSQYMNYIIPFVGNEYYCELGTDDD